MIVVDKVFRLADLPSSAAGYLRDTITLGWEDRQRGQGRRVSDGGVEFGISLPRGRGLARDDCFVLEPLSRLVVVREAEEAVFIIEPRRSDEWARYAYQIGNRHQPLMITQTELIRPAVPGMQLALDQSGIPYRAGRQSVVIAAGGAHAHSH